ncbi:unnamed protein product [Caenorhabditis sp. 36 PRJEB53466]|nr:unnamed protein product [Caenorhabditis sp. 36 PRJEB53466]
MYVNRAWQGRRSTVRKYAEEFPMLDQEAPVEQAHVEQVPVELVEQDPVELVEQVPVELEDQQVPVPKQTPERPKRRGQMNGRNDRQDWPGYKPPVPMWAKRYAQFGSDDWQAQKDQRHRKEREAGLAERTEKENLEKESEIEQPEKDAYDEWLKEGIAQGKREQRPVQMVPDMFAWHFVRRHR